MNTRTLLILASLSLACHEGTPTTHEPAPVEPEPETEPVAAVELPGIALAAGGHRSDIVDVVLSPDATAALTLDRSGGVRLWTALDGTREPLIIPIDDPSQLSLARSDGSFVIAALDTIGGAEVYEVREHDGELRLDVRFSISPADPLFELHTLDGGERLLALGVDHRVRLYDASGTELSSIDEHGFVPWQLRHVETDGGVALVAILAGPARVQPLSLRGDRLEIVGEPLRVELDRGPNRNDLALTPEGTHIAAFSRRMWRSGQWQLQLTSLADGSQTMIEGTLDSDERPRVHLLDGQQMLLDVGTGVGHIVSLDPAAPRTAATRPLPGSAEPTRLYASVERGVRVVPDGDHFIVDRLDGDEHLRLGHVRSPMNGAGLSPDGQRVIWAFADGWAIEPVDGGLERPKIQPSKHAPLLFADFVDDQHIVLVSELGTIELLDAETGQRRAGYEAPQSVLEIRFVRGGSPLMQVRDQWQGDSFLKVSSDDIRSVAETSDVWTSMRPRLWGHEPPRRRGASNRTVRPRDSVRQVPSPTGDRFAVVHDDGSVAVYDADTQARAWTRIGTAALSVSWAETGTRLVVAGWQGGMVLDAETGEFELERRDLGLHVERKTNTMPEPIQH